MPTRLRRTMRRLQPYIDRIEPITIFLTYITMGWSAYFAWFSPPNSVTEIQNETEQVVQAIMFTIGAACGLYGHITDRLFPEEIGIIFSAFAIALYVTTLTTYVIRNDDFWENGQIFGVLVISALLLINRGVRIQSILSSKWLKPNVSKYYTAQERSI